MHRKFLSAVNGWFAKFAASFKRFPETVISALALVSILLFMTHNFESHFEKRAFYETLSKLAMIFALGIPVFLIIRLCFERFPQLKQWHKITLLFGAALGLGAYYYWGIGNLTMVETTRYIAINIACYLGFLSIPFFYKRKNLELFCIQLLINLIVAFLYAIVIFSGVAATLFTINSLFGTHLENYYLDIWIITTGFFMPVHFLAKFPVLQTEFKPENYPKVLKILLVYIVIPLQIIYAAILYVYFAKVIIIANWPDGIVSHLVLWYGLLCSSIFFLLEPLRTEIKRLGIILKAFPIALLPLLAMLFASIGIRIHAYGITENRYFVLITGLWLTGWMLYRLLAKQANNLLLPFSLAIIALLTVIGPWSAYSLAKLDQSNRFLALLKKNDMLQNNKIVKPDQPISPQERSKISSILKYFDTYRGFKDLKPLPANFKLSQAPRILGFKIEDGYYSRKDESYFSYDSSENIANQLLNIQDFDYYLNCWSDSTQAVPDKKLTVTYQSEAKKLEIAIGNQAVYNEKTTDLVAPLFKNEPPASKKVLTITRENKRIKILYRFNQISGNKDSLTDAVEITNLNFTVFIKLKPSSGK